MFEAAPYIGNVPIERVISGCNEKIVLDKFQWISRPKEWGRFIWQADKFADRVDINHPKSNSTPNWVDIPANPWSKDFAHFFRFITRMQWLIYAIADKAPRIKQNNRWEMGQRNERNFAKLPSEAGSVRSRSDIQFRANEILFIYTIPIYIYGFSPVRKLQYTGSSGNAYEPLELAQFPVWTICSTKWPYTLTLARRQNPY